MANNSIDCLFIAALGIIFIIVMLRQAYVERVSRPIYAPENMEPAADAADG